MIFATVGTHEQPMLRLINALPRLATALPDCGPFFIQHGYSPLPDGWAGTEFLAGPEVDAMIDRSAVVICHAGPATIAQVRSRGRIPVVVPRVGRNEHVDDHQLWFARRLADAKEIIAVEDVEELPRVIADYERLVAELPPARAVDPAPAIQRFGIELELLSR